MLPSHTRPTLRDTSAHSRLLIHHSISRTKRALVTPQTTPLSFSTQRSSKIYPLFKELEMLSEFTEPHWDSITTRDNSMLACSTTAHGHSSQLIRNHHNKKPSETKRPQPMKMFHSHSQESTTPSKRMSLQPLVTSESGLTNTFHNTTLSPKTWFNHCQRLKAKRTTSMLLPRFSKSSN